MGDASEWATEVILGVWRRGPATERQVAERSGYSRAVVNGARLRLERQGRLRKVRVLPGHGGPVLWEVCDG
jgi:hypothetical protein